MPKVDLAKLKQWYSDDKQARSEWRKDAKKWFDFVDGEQWSEEDKAYLDGMLRPIITFNRIGPQVDAVTGLEINNRHEVTYRPREIGAVKVNEMLTNAAKWVRDNCDAEDQESEVFRDVAICGLGCTETYMDYDTEPDGKIMIREIDPIKEIYWDHRAREKNFSDANRIFRVREIDREEAKDMFPDVSEDVLNAGWAKPYDDSDGSSQSGPVDTYEDGDKTEGGISKDTVYIVEAQWWERRKVFYISDPASGDKQVLEVDEYKKLEQRMTELRAVWIPEMGPPPPPLDAVPLKKKFYKRAFIGTEILIQEDCPCPDTFTYKFVTGKIDRKGNPYGVVKSMIDPQEWANKWLSQTMHILNVNPKGGIIAEEDAVSNWAEFERDWADPSKVTKVADGAIRDGKIKDKPAVQFPVGMDRLMQFAVDSIPQVTGINPDAIGLADRNQPGILENMRKQSLMVILAPLFGNLRKYRKEQGRLLLYFITEYISDGRIIQIGEGKDAQYMPLLKQPKTIMYDVIVDESPTAPDQKTQTWMVLQQMIPFIANLGVPPKVWMEVIKYSPLPSTFSDSVAQIMQAEEAQKAQGPPPDPKMLEAQAKIQMNQVEMQLKQEKHQLELQQLMANIKKTESETIKNLALAEAAEVGPQLEQYKQQMSVLGQDIAHQQAMVKQHQAHQQKLMQQEQAAQLEPPPQQG